MDKDSISQIERSLSLARRWNRVALVAAVMSIAFGIAAVVIRVWAVCP